MKGCSNIMKQDKNKLLSKSIAAVSNMFMPLMNLLCAGGIMKGALLISWILVTRDENIVY